MEALLLCINGPTPDEAEAAFRDMINDRCAIAFAAECRLAIRRSPCPGKDPRCLHYRFVVLSPGEKPPPGIGWEIYEDHGGRVVARSA